MVATKRLFLARTADKNVFLKQKTVGQSKFETKLARYLQKKSIPCSYTDEQKKEIRRHRMIRISTKDNACLFFYNLIAKAKIIPLPLC